MSVSVTDCDSCGKALTGPEDMVQMKFPDIGGVMGAIIDLCLDCGSKLLADPKAKKAQDNWDKRQPGHADQRKMAEAKKQGISPAKPATPEPHLHPLQPEPQKSVS